MDCNALEAADATSGASLAETVDADITTVIAPLDESSRILASSSPREMQRGKWPTTYRTGSLAPFCLLAELKVRMSRHVQNRVPVEFSTRFAVSHAG